MVRRGAWGTLGPPHLRQESMNRIQALVRAQLSGEVMGERTPVAALALQVVVAGLLCAVVRGEVGGYGYALFSLSIPLGLVTIPLLGELAPLLRADRAAEWVGALPVRPRDLRLARVWTLLLIVGFLALASLIPAALLAPADLDLAARGWIVLGGLLQVWTVTAGLLALQVGLGRGSEGALVFLQTVVFVGVMVGLLVGLRSLPILAELNGGEAYLTAVPPAWFAAPLAPAGPGLPGIIGATLAVLGAAVLAFAPFPPAPRARSTRSVLGTLLSPIRRLAEAAWVRNEERGPFGLVYDGLPAERDFVVRTYPLVAAPLVVLLLGADPSTVEGEGMFALLLFAPAAYLPFIVMHVPTTSTPEARWVVDTSPLEADVEDRGALKAVAIRLLVPLYLGIGALVYTLGSPALALRLWPVAVAAGIVTLRLLFARGTARPLSERAQDLASAWSDGLGGLLMGISVGMTLIAVAAWRMIPSATVAWSILGAVVAAELLLGGRLGRPAAPGKSGAA